jgi:hypothetical protein
VRAQLNSHIIHANYNDETIRVYQAYGEEIALPALKAGTFVAPFKMARMTWIKPSFNWMMYRSGYGSKQGQEFVLAIDISREGFDWALENSVLSSFRPEANENFEDWQKAIRNSPVRVQWDPARNWRLDEIDGLRAIQIGLSGEAVERYVKEWIRSIADVTALAHSISLARDAKSVPEFPLHQHIFSRSDQ